MSHIQSLNENLLLIFEYALIKFHFHLSVVMHHACIKACRSQNVKCAVTLLHCIFFYLKKQTTLKCKCTTKQDYFATFICKYEFIESTPIIIIINYILHLTKKYYILQISINLYSRILGTSNLFGRSFKLMTEIMPSSAIIQSQKDFVNRCPGEMVKDVKKGNYYHKMKHF